MAYNVRAHMKGLFYTAGLALALGAAPGVQAVEAVLEADPGSPMGDSTASAQTETLGQEFLKTASEMWFLLSGIRDTKDADAAAPRFAEQVQKIFELDELMSRLPIVPLADDLAVGMMETLQVRILEAMDDINSEFVSLCRVNCYDSAPLRDAFRSAVKMGMFAEEDFTLVRISSPPMAKADAQQEMNRLQRLQEPDRVMLAVLAAVLDADSARQAVPALVRLAERLQVLLPPEHMAHNAYSDADARLMQEAIAPLQPLLWGIRNEIVRIAALPGYEAECYDAFSDTLDITFQYLCEAHCGLSDSVFDASFRTDLDEALQQNVTSSH